MEIVLNKNKIAINKRKSAILDFGFITAIFLNNISQLPIFIDNGVTSLICLLGWFISLVCIFLTGFTVNYDRLLKFLLLPTFIVVYSLVLNIFTGKSYSLITNNIIISMCIFSIGYLYSSKKNKFNISIITQTYIVSALIVSFAIFLKYFSGINIIGTTQYAYDSKNSISHILLAAVFMCMFEKPKKRSINFIKWIVFLILLFMIIYLKSRAAYIGFFSGILVYIFSKKTNIKIKIFLIICIVTLFFVLKYNSVVYDVLVNNFLLSNRDINNFDAISSGRLSIIRSFPYLFKNNWAFGAGSVYFECFPLAALINYGLFIGLIVNILALTPIKCYFLCKEKILNKENILFACIIVSFLSDALFECLAPFGPGAKCYILWMLCGVFYGRKSYINKNE